MKLIRPMNPRSGRGFSLDFPTRVDYPTHSNSDGKKFYQG
jgi:hypothetical protein